MKFNFDTDILDLEEKPLTTSTAGKNETYRSLAIQALLFTDPRQQLPPNVKEQRYRLAVRLSQDESDLDVDDVKLIKDVVLGGPFTILAAGRMASFLNQPE